MLAFFEARRGSLHAFRFRDPFDMKSCRPGETVTAFDQQIGVGDGSKAAVPAGEDLWRRCGCLSPGHIEAGRRDSPGCRQQQRACAHYGFFTRSATGEVVFPAGGIPAANAIITAGFEFDVPVRFDTERLEVSMTAFKAGQIPSIPLIEVQP